MDEREIIEKKDDTEDGVKAEEAEKPADESKLAEATERYLRLYAEFENYKKRTQRDKEELVRFTKESLLSDILPVIDNLEMALSHSAPDLSGGLVKGVEITLKEFQRVTEKFGLIPIASLGKPFDPSVHHAMTQVERDDVDDKTVVEEFRKGYMLSGRVLRPSLVSVSKKPSAERTIEIESE